MFTKINKQKKKGFTLVELLVTISMFVIITGVILVNSNKFDSTELLNNFAYDVALSIKQAQSYGVNVRESSSGTFDSYYGVFFDTGTLGSKTNFVLFDYTPQNIYDQNALFDAVSKVNIKDPCTTNSACIQKYTMGRGTQIKSICTGKDENSCQQFDGKIIFVFKRPALDAIIYTISGSTPTKYEYARITLSAASGATSTVVITSIGQIFVKK